MNQNKLHINMYIHTMHFSFGLGDGTIKGWLAIA